jgi:hypothetical protein
VIFDIITKMGLVWLIFLPVWPIAACLFGGSVMWMMMSFLVAGFVHRVLNTVTLGSFAKSLEDFMAPDKNEPKGLAR